MVRKAVILFIGYFLFFDAEYLYSQQLQLPLNIRAEDGQYSKLILVTPIFAFRGDSVSNPLDISAAVPDDKVIWKQAKLPDMAKNLTSGFAWVYDGSSDLTFAPSYTLIAVQNPTRTYYPTLVWVDKNHNFDFTDDGIADTITVYHGIEVALGSNAHGYHVYLEHFPLGKFRPFNNMNDSAVVKVKGNRYFYGTAYSFREKRLNVLATKWTNGRDSFCIGIKDVNCNGKYDDAEMDVVMITDYHGVFDNLQGVQLNSHSAAYLEWNNVAYNIKKVDASGNFMELYRDTAVRLKNSLNVGDKLPRFKYCSATKPAKHRSIRRLKGKYVYVYVWRDGEPVFLRDSASWHQLGRMKNPELEVLGLNYGASARYVYQYNNYYETAIRHGYSSNDINRRLKVKQIPTGILIDKKQRIVAVGITPDQVGAYLR